MSNIPDPYLFIYCFAVSCTCALLLFIAGVRRGKQQDLKKKIEARTKRKGGEYWLNACGELTECKN